MDFYPRAAHNW